VNSVREFCDFLLSNGINARLDQYAAERPQDWSLWTFREIRAARFVLVVASPAYRHRAEGDARADEGRGAQYETTLIRQEIYANRAGARDRFLPVVLPQCSQNDIPLWMTPISATTYFINDYTVRGAERLLRLLTDQPYNVAPPKGIVPRLPTRTNLRSATTAAANSRALVRRIADRTQPRNEQMVQADVRQLLVDGDVGLKEEDLGTALPLEADDWRRIEIVAASAVIEVRGTLLIDGVREAAEHGLDRYLAVRDGSSRRTLALLTDGAEWRPYLRVNGRFQQCAPTLSIDLSTQAADRLLPWIESVLATGHRVTPSPKEIERRLGAQSPSYAVDRFELTSIFEKYREDRGVKVKRSMWAKLLMTAHGTAFSETDDLFIDHTLLVTAAKVIGHAVVGLPTDATSITSQMILSGQEFARAQIGGVIEADFFDWITMVPEGERFVKDLARRLRRFAWEHVDHDVMKVLYESIIGRDTRKLLGEYYSPDWLATEIIAACVDDPLSQRVLDASCGSGTFLFHAIRHYLATAEMSGQPTSVAIHGVVGKVIGIDVHPVACTLAKVTYLLGIGMERLQAHDRPAFTVPVYLSDSLSWGRETTLLTYRGLSIPTADEPQSRIYDTELVDPTESTDRLQFPDRLVADVQRFDRLVTEFADLATDRFPGSAVPSLTAMFRRYEIDIMDQPVLRRTFTNMCHLHDEGRDHIWGYYVRNLARPMWLSLQHNRVDVLVGNPPWLAYRYMTEEQQSTFLTMCKERNLWAGGGSATHQDLSALFVIRCIELYLRPSGRFGYVMPWGILSRRQHAGFRTGSYPSREEPVKVAFDRPWDLHAVKPAFFPVPASVVFGRRMGHEAKPVPLDQKPVVWSGRLGSGGLARMVEEDDLPSSQRASPYTARFSAGATVFPRLFFLVEPANPGPLGVGEGRLAVRSHRAANEKKPWRSVASLQGTVERQFVRPLYVGSSILPFRCLQPHLAIIPWDGADLLDGDDESLDLYPGFAAWWRSAESAWMQYRSSARLSLAERVNYRRGLTVQFPAASHRVVYNASGMYVAAAIVSDRSAVIEHKLYWSPVAELSEARYLTAILNSSAVTKAVRPKQARGEHNPRDFDKYIFELPIPAYDASEHTHLRLVALAERSERIVAAMALPAMRFEALRRRIRNALVEDGVAGEVDDIVESFLVT
jgi:hypothetical protein